VTSPISSAVHRPPLPYVGRGVPGGRLAMPRPALYGRRVPTEGQPNPYPDPSRPLDGYVAPLLCELTPLSDNTKPGLPSSLLPAPQSETDGEEEVIMVGLAPGFKRHVTRGYVCGPLVVL
jgi:hypothetical protein